VIAGGGKLAEIAKEKNYPLTLLPPAAQPRFALLSGLKALVTFLERANIVAAADAEKSLHEAAEYLRQATQAWIAEVPTAQNQAKQIAEKLTGKSVVVYAGPMLYPAAYKWKISFNENAKHIAWVNQYSELNHNEMLGWTEQPKDKPYAMIELRSPLEHPRIQKRFEVTQNLLNGLRPEPIVIVPQGENLLEQMLWTIALGDFVTLYRAILNGINPTPVVLIEKFKKDLG
jgi:glucose/mannose-6-phosphate isomerase